MSVSTKRKREKKGNKEGSGPLNPLEITSARRVGLTTMGGGTTTMAAHILVCTSKIKNDNIQNTDP